MKRIYFIATVCILQLFIIAGMAIEREWIVSTGERVWLVTKPVDPRDFFRGDYATLGYAITSIPDTQYRSLKFQPGEVVYVVPKTDSGPISEIASISAVKPDSGLFFKGRVRWSANIAYGIEKLFREQGQADIMPNWRDKQVMTVEAAVGKDGVLVLTGNYKITDPDTKMVE